jgi:hypothetical protein
VPREVNMQSSWCIGFLRERLARLLIDLGYGHGGGLIWRGTAFSRGAMSPNMKRPQVPTTFPPPWCACYKGGLRPGKRRPSFSVAKFFSHARCRMARCHDAIQELARNFNLPLGISTAAQFPLLGAPSLKSGLLQQISTQAALPKASVSTDFKTAPF